MKELEIYDPAMCCSTGVCGPSPDEELVAFAGELKALNQAAKIERFNLAQEPAAFAGNSIVQEILSKEGPDALPVILIDGQLAMKGVYPTKQQLQKLIGAEKSECSDEPEEDSCCGGDSCC